MAFFWDIYADSGNDSNIEYGTDDTHDSMPSLVGSSFDSDGKSMTRNICYKFLIILKNGEKVNEFTMSLFGHWKCLIIDLIHIRY